MGEIFNDIIGDWGEGVITSMETDALPPNASPRGWNAVMISLGGNKATIAKRRGMRTSNRTPVTGSPVLLGQAWFKRYAGGTYTGYHLLFGDNGRVETLNSDGTTSLIGTLTSGTYYPSVEVADNIACVVNGVDAKKYDGTEWTNLGITRPTVGTLAGAAGAAGSPNGTYELRVSFGCSTTGAESSASDTAAATVSVSSQAINWSNLPVSADPQVDRRYLLVRNTATMTQFYRAGTVTDNTSATATTDFTDANLITVAPDTAENDPVPTGVKYLAWHNSRLFAASDTRLYFSNLDAPEAFDPDNWESVNPDDGQVITAIHKAYDTLLIFKTHSLYALLGDDPQSWKFVLLDPQIGTTSSRSVVTVEGRTYFWSDQGPMVWDAAGAPRQIGNLIQPTWGPDALNYGQLARVCAVADIPNQHVLFAVPETGQSRNSLIIPFNYRLGRWASDRWDPMDVASFTTVEDTNGRPWVMLGNYAGQAFKWWDADNDGVASGTMSGTFTAAGTSVTTVTDAGATFDTTGAGLIERKVSILDSAGQPLGSTRQRITTNDATSFTLAAAVAGLTVGATYTYVVGGPDFQWDTAWQLNGLEFFKKRYEFLYAQLNATPTAIEIGIDLAFNYDTGAGQRKSLSFSTEAPDATWDSSLWDAATYGTQAHVNKRLRVGRTGWCWRARFTNPYPDETVGLMGCGMRGEFLTDKLG